MVSVRDRQLIAFLEIREKYKGRGPDDDMTNLEPCETDSPGKQRTWGQGKNPCKACSPDRPETP